MRTHRLVSVALLLIVLSSTAPRTAAPDAAPPHGDGPVKLVLLIAVDQFRYDYLTRFRRRIQRGLQSPADRRRGLHERVPRALPHRHGRRPLDDDERRHAVGERHRRQRLVRPEPRQERDQRGRSGHAARGRQRAPASSPRRMLVGTVGDELKSASRAPAGSEQAPKVFGLSLKDRVGGAAGRPHGQRRLLARHDGRQLRHEHLLPRGPARLGGDIQREEAGRQRMPARRGPISIRRAWRGHRCRRSGRPVQRRLRQPVRQRTPRSFAEAALEAEKLGQRGVTDLLSVSFSSNDSVGHSLRPRQPAGARHRRADGSRHRRTAGARGRARRPRPHASSSSRPTTASPRCPKSSSSGTCPADADKDEAY